MSANLESSLTMMDWLPNLRPMSSNDHGSPSSTDSPRCRRNDRTSFDPYATLSAEEAEQFSKSNAKPPFSYANMITFAINSSSKKMMTLSEIYGFITDHFPFYRTAGMAWKNSIRHNLSLHKSFVKNARPQDDPGKGSYWAIDPDPPLDDDYLMTRGPRQQRKISGKDRRPSSPYARDDQQGWPMATPAAGQTLAAINSSGSPNLSPRQSYTLPSRSPYNLSPTGVAGSSEFQYGYSLSPTHGHLLGNQSHHNSMDDLSDSFNNLYGTLAPQPDPIADMNVQHLQTLTAPAMPYRQRSVSDPPRPSQHLLSQLTARHMQYQNDSATSGSRRNTMPSPRPGSARSSPCYSPVSSPQNMQQQTSPSVSPNQENSVNISSGQFSKLLGLLDSLKSSSSSWNTGQLQEFEQLMQSLESGHKLTLQQIDLQRAANMASATQPQEQPSLEAVRMQEMAMLQKQQEEYQQAMQLLQQQRVLEQQQQYPYGHQGSHDQSAMHVPQVSITRSETSNMFPNHEMSASLQADVQPYNSPTQLQGSASLVAATPHWLQSQVVPALAQAIPRLSPEGSQLGSDPQALHCRSDGITMALYPQQQQEHHLAMEQNQWPVTEVEDFDYTKLLDT